MKLEDTQEDNMNNKEPNLQNLPIRTEEGKRIRDLFVHPTQEQVKAAYNARFVEMFNKDAAGWWTYTRGGNFTFHTAHRTILRGAIERDKEGKERVRFVYESEEAYQLFSKYPINPDRKQLRWGRRGELPESDRPLLEELRSEFENWWVDVEGGMLL